MGKLRKYKLVAFDLDGVLTDHISSWMWVHQHFNVDNEEGYRLFQEKKIDDLVFMRKDISLWLKKKPDLKEYEVEEILNKVPITKGSKETFEVLKMNGIKTAIISGGIDLLAKRVGAYVGADFVFANAL
ncbi:MAG TPA: haloacid dehalogenase, partial [Thermoplasmata archaeon]|nr:haloacid dehalogenase [Thermoplasmata archaeon]